MYAPPVAPAPPGRVAWDRSPPTPTHKTENRQCWMVLFDLLQNQHKKAYFSFHVLRTQIRCDSIHYFQRSLDWGFQWTMRYQFICSIIIWIRGWGCCRRCWKFCLSMAFRGMLLGTVGLAGLGTDLMVLFFFCDFFWGLGMLKRPEAFVVWRFGRSLRPGKPSNSPRWCGSPWGPPVRQDTRSDSPMCPPARLKAHPKGRHFHQAVYLPTMNSQWSYLSFCLNIWVWFKVIACFTDTSKYLYRFHKYILWIIWVFCVWFNG